MDIKDFTNDAIKLLKELIAIPSISKDEAKAADKLSEYLNKWGLPHGREGNNLWIGTTTVRPSCSMPISTPCDQ